MTASRRGGLMWNASNAADGCRHRCETTTPEFLPIRDSTIAFGDAGFVGVAIVALTAWDRRNAPFFKP
jgi:hypothetical protein